MKIALPRKFLRDRKGGTAIEYGLIAGLITLGLIGAMTMWGGEANEMYSSLGEGWPGGEDADDPES
jgi:pilus assembly protein Flp/PilA